MLIVANLFVLISCAFYVYIIVDFTKYIYGFRENVSSKTSYIVIAAFICSFTLLTLQSIPLPLLYIIALIVGFIPYHLSLKGTVLQHLLLAGASIFDAIAFRGITVSIFAIGSSSSLYEIINNDLMYSLSLGISFILCSAFWHFGNPRMYEIDHLIYVMSQREQMIVVAIIEYLSITVMIVGSMIYYRPDFTLEMTWYHMLTDIAMLIMLYSILAFCSENGFMQQSKDAYSLYEQQLERQIQAYTEQLEYIKQMRKIRHDWAALKLSMLNKTSEENMEDVNEIYNEMSNSLQELSNCYQEFSSNPLIQAILTHIRSLCIKSNIKLDASVMLPENLPVSDFDLCRVFVNIMNNAVEANERIQDDSPKYIYITTSVSKGWCTISCKNSFNGEIRIEKDMFESVKEDSYAHGFGIKNIEDIIDSYGGFVKIEVDVEEKVFLIRVHIPLEGKEI